MSVHRPPSDGIVSVLERYAAAVSRYDLVLAVVPIALALAAAVGLFSSVSLHATLAVGALGASLAVVDALFVSPPGREEDPSADG